MDGGIVRLMVIAIIGAHGVGHALGWMPALGVRIDGVSGHSWMLSGMLGESGARLASAAVFLVPTVGFVVAAGGLATAQPWWRQVAVASAAASLAGTALFPHALPASSMVGSFVANVVVLGAILVGWGASGTPA